MCRTPLAITSIAAMVITPALLRPPKSSLGVAIPSRPAATRAQIRARTAGALPVVIAMRVATTMTAATSAMHRILDYGDRLGAFTAFS